MRVTVNPIEVKYYTVAGNDDPFADDKLVAVVHQPPGTIPRKDDWVRIVGVDGEHQVAVVTWNVAQLGDPIVEILLR